jgi:antitoxin (DNA-binding transcriptional repressor) of toxin-antitoxin stability system
VESGEPVLITRRSRAIAELVPRRAVRELLLAGRDQALQVAARLEGVPLLPA